GGVRIPHWHPDAAELDYCLAGKARIGLGFPDGEWQRFDLAAGQIAILPQGWFHYIQNIGDDPLRMLVIFNNSVPNDIGVSVGFQAVPKEVLATTFGVPAERFGDFDLDVPYIAPK
ncbi:MAG TPA: cupin domain-containing protein, partial [Candidatus Dormibacteraeota bacterium]|nr:cupin domain-containing protein [Candidatus Dormibacteraeota bacterium]